MQDFSLSGLVSPIIDRPEYRDLVSGLARTEPGSPHGPLGLPEAARPPVVAAMLRTLKAPILWITPQPDEARAVADALRAYLADESRVHLLPAPDALPYERVPWDPTTRELRLAALGALHRWRMGERVAPVVVASVRAALIRTLSPEAFAADVRSVRVGDRVQVSDFVNRLERLGYEPASNVAEPGEMARRGGIVDVYPPTEPGPVRLEWFGDEVDSLRRFDPADQRSSGTIEELLLVPASEVLVTRGEAAAATLNGLDLRRLHPLAQSEIRRHAEQLAAGERFPAIEFYGPLLHSHLRTALDHLPAEGWIVFDDDRHAVATAEELGEQAHTIRTEQVDAGEMPEDWPGEPLAPAAELRRFADAHRVATLGRAGQVEPESLAAAFGAAPRYGGRIDEAVTDAGRMAEQGRAVIVVSRQAPRVTELFEELGIHAPVSQALEKPPGPGGMAIVHGILGSGWTLGEGHGQLVLLTDGELFGWRMPHRRRQSRASDTTRSAEFFSEYLPGDYVVHIEHGIGVFRGIERLQLGGPERDYLKIEYAQSDMLFVPTHQADRVARYVGVGDVDPSVSRLGTADWDRAKERARKAVEEIAKDLLELYAKREVARRQAFATDTTWQAEMEAAFPYVETEDQLRAIEAVKRDMESERPMDRLVVGDVGFGKTEVALRAAFKAVMEGKQVAVLVPTTVLAQQHYETFRERMAAFPVRVEMLSRFRSRNEQKEIIERLGAGELDVIIGTHRLLSQDIKFPKLGLLVIDEEHRFGVKHKERLRQLKANVDTLTLTATPIPRTMHMALSGLRDLTTIDTPPEERLPVVTHVGPYDEVVVRQAVRRELGRRGQVFYVFNRVQGIEMVAQKLQKLVPEARTRTAHGQMREDELARAMLDFAGGAVDVLVCTSIIESGLDIPNANTLIVERADRFGLAQLHQLRGRVGRGPQRAYAYFLHPAAYRLQPDAEERLAAIAEASDLGAGFRLAMRDLEIRGAGEILGAKQHGQVASIGLDLYTRLLAEAIKKLRADEPTEDKIAAEIDAIDPGTLPTVDLPIDAYLPIEYVSETETRTRLYRRMAAADSLDQVDDLASELEDRFGPSPTEVKQLLAVLRLRILAHLAGAESIGREGDFVAVHWAKERSLTRHRLRARLGPKARIGRSQLSIPLHGSVEDWIAALENALAVAAEVEGARRDG